MPGAGAPSEELLRPVAAVHEAASEAFDVTAEHPPVTAPDREPSGAVPPAQESPAQESPAQASPQEESLPPEPAATASNAPSEPVRSPAPVAATATSPTSAPSLATGGTVAGAPGSGAVLAPPAPPPDRGTVTTAASAPPAAPATSQAATSSEDARDAEDDEAGAVPAFEPPAERKERPLPRVIAVANQKGGVGKTTTAVNLGASLALLGYRVLLVDLDPQGNATTGLGVDGRGFEHSMYDVLLNDTPMVDCIEPVGIEHLFLAPATLDLAGVEQELFSVLSRELRLKRALQTVVDDYDFVLIDCPPSLGLITINAFAAASEILVPVQCEYYALEGLTQLQRIVTLVQRNLNEELEISTVVLTMYDARTRLSEEVANEVRRHFPSQTQGTVIPRTVRLSEAPSFGQPITTFDPASKGARAYKALAREVSDGAQRRAG